MGRDLEEVSSETFLGVIKTLEHILRKQWLWEKNVFKMTSWSWKESQTRKNALVEYLDYQIPVTQLKGQKENGDMEAADRDWNAPPTPDHNI